MVDGTSCVEEGWGRDSGHGFNLLSVRGLALGLWFRYEFLSEWRYAILAQDSLRNHFPAHPTNDLKTSARFSGFPRVKPESGQVAFLFRGSTLHKLTRN